MIRLAAVQTRASSIRMHEDLKFETMCRSSAAAHDVLRLMRSLESTCLQLLQSYSNKFGSASSSLLKEQSMLFGSSSAEVTTSP
jgi:hypothetical protein